MGIELQDFRGRITPETHAVLEGQSRATGQDRQEIARLVLHEWAMRQIHASSVMDSLLQAQGLPGIGSGTTGHAGAREGSCGNACRGGGK